MDRIEALRAYVRLVERGSFTGVADELQVKQSTVSKWVANLENELGVTLVDRTTRTQRVTPEGQRFYARAQDVLAVYESAVAEMRAGQVALRGRIRLNLPVVFGQRFVVPLVARFLRQHPGIELEMAFDDRYVNLLADGHDLAVRIGASVDSSLTQHVLGRSERRVVASPGYLKAHGHPRTVRELEAHQCIVHTGLGMPGAWSFQLGGRKVRASVRGRISASNSEAAAALARSGLGLCMLADWLVDADLRAGRLVRVLPDWQTPDALICVLTPPGRRLPMRVQALIDCLRDGMPVIHEGA